MNYKNFDLSIELIPGKGYQVRVWSETLGEDYTGVFTLTDDCQKLLKALDVVLLKEGDKLPIDLGGLLFQGLFKDEIRDVWNLALGPTRSDEDAGVRFRLRLSPPELAVLPWEVLYSQFFESFVCTSEKTPLTRYLEIRQPIRNLKITPPIKVLLLVPGGSGLNFDKELQFIAEELEEPLKKRVPVDVTVLKDKVTRAEISGALVDEQFHILHFIGHGTFEDDQGYLVINKEEKGEDRISADTFADFFRDHPSLKLVVLNSCRGAQVSPNRKHSGMAHQLVSRGIPAVIAMQYPVSDEAALVFAKEFYRKLCSERSAGLVDAAISHARNQIHIQVKEPMAFATPVLFMRSPSGAVFDFHEKVSIVRSFLRLFTDYTIENIGRWEAVKETREQNCKAWEKISQEAKPEERAEAVRALDQEKQELRAINFRIIKWLAAAIVVFLYGYFGLFGGAPFHIDNWIEGKVMPLMDWGMNKSFSSDVKLILADRDGGGLGVPGPAWRQYHDDLIAALTKAGAKVIVFDLEMSTDTQHDADFAAAITDAQKQGTQVILAKGLTPAGALEFDLAQQLKMVVNEKWGNIIVGGERGGFLRIYQLAQPERTGAAANRQAPETPVVPSLGLQAVLTFLSANGNAKAFYSHDVEQIQLRSDGALIKSIPAQQNNQELFDFPFDLATTRTLNNATSSYEAVYKQRENLAALRDQFAGKIVLVGFREGDLFNVLWGEQRSGAELHANVISNILTDVYVRVPPWYINLFLAVLMVALGVVVRKRFRQVFSTTVTLSISKYKKTIGVPGLLIVADVIYLLVAVLLYRTQYLYVLQSFHLAAPFLAYWVTGKIARRPKLRPVAGVT